MGDFATDTAIEGRDGRYRASLSRDWEIWGPNGGYVAAIALRAAGASTPLRRPASFACHFLSVAEFDQVDLTVTTLRAAKRAASLRVSMTQKERTILEAFVWVIGDVDGLQHDTTQMPHVPSPHDLRPIEELIESGDDSPHSFWQNLERRPTHWVARRDWQPGPPSLHQWLRFRPQATFDDPFVDAARALLLIDTMLWPAAWQRYGMSCPYIAPSIDVFVRFHHLAPHEEWLLADVNAPIANAGLIGAEARIWATDGSLLASGGGNLLCRPTP